LTFDTTFLTDSADIESHRRALRNFSRDILPLTEDRRLTLEIVVMKTMASAATGVSTIPVDASALDSFFSAVKTEVDFADLNRRQHSPIVSINVLDHCVLVYQKLVRDWLRPSLPTRSILLELPSVNGMECSLQLTAGYQTLPFAMDSADFERLLVDLKDLHRLHLLNPLAMGSVDSSLMFGVPIMVETALQDDFHATRQMQNLFQGLLVYLQQRQLAMLLECTLVEQEDSPVKNEMRLFGGRANNTFILFPQQVSVSVPQTAIMFRYARADQLVQRETFFDSTPPSAACKLDDSSGKLFEAYFQEVLETLQASDNPLDERLVRATAGSTGRHQGTLSVARGVIDETVGDNWVEHH
jgi:hypothetical protein